MDEARGMAEAGELRWGRERWIEFGCNMDLLARAFLWLGWQICNYRGTVSTLKHTT